jgi:hypothetical protein
MILTPTQRRAMERGIATSNEVLQILDTVKVAAEVDESLAPRERELRALRDRLHRLCATFLQRDRDARNG